MTDQSELEKAKQKLSGFGINLEAVMNEMVAGMLGQIEARIKELIPQVDIESIAIRAASIMPKVDVSEVVAQLKAQLPDSGAVEAESIAQSVRKELSADLKEAIEGIQERNAKGVEKLREDTVTMVRETYASEGRDVMQAIRDKFASMAEESKTVGAASGRAGGMRDLIDTISPLVEKIINKQDPMTAASQYWDIRNKIMGMEPAGPSPDTQFKVVSNAFMEGRKIQASADRILYKSEGRQTRPLPSSPTRGQSTDLAVDYSKVDPIIRKLKVGV